MNCESFYVGMNQSCLFQTQISAEMRWWTLLYGRARWKSRGLFIEQRPQPEKIGYQYECDKWTNLGQNQTGCRARRTSEWKLVSIKGHYNAKGEVAGNIQG